MSYASGDYTGIEKRNVQLAREHMPILSDPKRGSACAPGNRFIAGSTFSDIHTLEQNADDHGKRVKALNEPDSVSFEVLFALQDRVAIRYTPEGNTSERLTDLSNQPGRRLSPQRPHCSDRGWEAE
jgi:hypothetical protein